MIFENYKKNEIPEISYKCKQNYEVNGNWNRKRECEGYISA
jgi:hypothetical protein